MMINDILKTATRDDNGKIILIFTHAYQIDIRNLQSATPNAAWAIVEIEDNKIVIIKESKSTSAYYAKQDIGFSLHSPAFPEHYNTSNNQFDQIFGENQYIKKWMNKDEYMLFRSDKSSSYFSEAKSLQEESWKSTGHR